MSSIRLFLILHTFSVWSEMWLFILSFLSLGLWIGFYIDWFYRVITHHCFTFRVVFWLISVKDISFDLTVWYSWIMYFVITSLRQLIFLCVIDSIVVLTSTKDDVDVLVSKYVSFDRFSRIVSWYRYTIFLFSLLYYCLMLINICWVKNIYLIHFGQKKKDRLTKK